MQGYFRFVLRHRIAVLLICLLLTVLALFSLSRAIIASSLPKLFFGGDPEYLKFTERAREFGGDQFLIIAFEQRDIRSKAGRERLQRITGRITALPGVVRVSSVLGIQRLREQLNLSGGEGQLDIEALASDPLAGGLLISRDGRHTAVLVEFSEDEERSMERAPAIVGGIVEVFLQEGFRRDDLHLGGLLAVVGEMQDQVRRNVRSLTPLVAIILLLATYVLFRRLWPVFLTLVVGVLAILWTLGFAILLNPEVNILLAACPAIILLISFSDLVHLSSAYLLEISRGLKKEDAIFRCATHVGRACFYTSVTTFMGFLGLALINVPVLRQLGVVLGFGVAVALILAMTLAPILFSLLGSPRPTVGVWGSQRLLDRILRGMHAGATSHPWLVIAGFAALVALSLLGMSRIRIETDLLARFSPGNRLRADVEYLNRHFAGIGVLDLYIQIPADVDLLDSSLLRRLGEYQDALERDPAVGKVLSLVNVLREVKVPDSVLQLAAAASPDLRRLVHPASRRLRLILFLNETGVYGTYEFGLRAAELGKGMLGQGISVEPSGFGYITGGWLEKHIHSQRRAIWISFSAIAVMMALVFRSFSLGLWSMVPNLVPLLALVGMFGFIYDAIDSDLTALALIAMGIAVDDTIHFLTRFLAAGGPENTSQRLKQAYSYAGRAIVMTSLIFAAGFLPFALSDYLSIRVIGIYLPLVMIIALLADLLLLPALLTVGAIRIKK